MTDKQAVIDAFQRLPENSSLKEITQKLRLKAAIRQGRDDVAAGRTKTHEEVEKKVEFWASAWGTKLFGLMRPLQISMISARTSHKKNPRAAERVG